MTAKQTEAPLRERVRKEIEAERAAQLEAEIDARITRMKDAEERAAAHARLCSAHGLDPAVTSTADVARVEWLAAQAHRGQVVAKHGPAADPGKFARGSLAPIEGDAA